jgi:hypothetical protein
MVTVLVASAIVGVLAVLYQIRKCTGKFKFKEGTLPDGVLPSEGQLQHGLFDST